MTILQTLMERAKQGDAAAIAVLINDALISQKIRVKVILQDGCLQVMFRASRPLNQHATIAFTRRGMLRIRPTSVVGVRLYAWQIDEDFPDWISEFLLEPSPEQAVQEEKPVRIPAVVTQRIEQKTIEQKTIEPVSVTEAIAPALPARVVTLETAPLSSSEVSHALQQQYEAIGSSHSPKETAPEPVLEQFSADMIQVALDEVYRLPIVPTPETSSKLKPKAKKKLTKVDSAVQFSVMLMFVVVFYFLVT